MLLILFSLNTKLKKMLVFMSRVKTGYVSQTNKEILDN